MSCRSPICIQSPLPSSNKYIYVPCGRCAWCRRDKRNEWSIRFEVEMNSSKFTDFVTLTYNEDNIPFYLDEETGECGFRARKEDIQKFIKRLRKAGHQFKYFVVSEYGPKTQRPHYHALFFSDDYIDTEEYQNKWNKGFVSKEPAGEGSLRYVTKYILKGNNRDGNFMLCSKRPAIGAGYIKESNAYQCFRKTEDGIYAFSMPVTGGQLVPLPRYYKKKFKQFFNELDFEMNQVKLIKQMEERPKQYYLEKKYMKNFDDQLKFNEHLNAKYIRDTNEQIKINNKSKDL